MAGTLSLSYADLKSAIRERRFPTSSPVEQWLAAAYTDIWTSADWTFRKVSRATFYTTADGLSGGTPSATPLMPSAFSQIIGLYDEQGSKLQQLAEEEFERYFTEATPSTGHPDTFTVINRQVILYPTPAAAYAFKISYKRRLATRTNAGVVQAGFFVADTDIPLWDDHHYLLVLRAKLIGLRDRSDPTASDLEGEFGRLLDAMREEYIDSLPVGAHLPSWS
jgi:hypothetical protein